MLFKQNSKILGVIGGMGPLASAEFLKTIYNENLQSYEQNSPFVIIYSDPTFPDRTNSYQQGNTSDLLSKLIKALCYLTDGGARKIVICCITSHYLLPQIPGKFKDKVISLLDIIIAEVMRSSDKHLLLCSTGSRDAEIFENHPKWNSVKDKFILPDDGEQKEIHNLIYQIKTTGKVDDLLIFLKRIAKKYKTNSFIAGCTEIHLLTRYISSATNKDTLDYIDPLQIIAKDLTNFMI